LLVLHKGKIRLFDSSLDVQLDKIIPDHSKYCTINIGGSIKFVEGNLPLLYNSIKKHNPNIVLPFEVSESAAAFAPV